MAKRTKLTGTYQAAGESGNRYIVHVFTDVLDTGGLDGPSEVEGMQAHRLANGDHVNVGQDGTLVVLRTGEKLRRL